MKIFIMVLIVVEMVKGRIRVAEMRCSNKVLSGDLSFSLYIGCVFEQYREMTRPLNIAAIYIHTLEDFSDLLPSVFR